MPCGANKHIAHGHGGVSDIRGRPHFSCLVIRTSVRYKGIVRPLCSYCVFPPMVSFCASCSCYLMSWWRRPRGSCGANDLLSIYIVPSRLLRLVGRLVMRLVLASRGGVSLCVSFPRLVVGFSL